MPMKVRDICWWRVAADVPAWGVEPNMPSRPGLDRVGSSVGHRRQLLARRARRGSSDVEQPDLIRALELGALALATQLQVAADLRVGAVDVVVEVCCTFAWIAPGWRRRAAVLLVELDRLELLLVPAWKRTARISTVCASRCRS